MNPTILIVDDEKHTREGLRASLEDNFDVYIAGDAASALGLLEREAVDLGVPGRDIIYGDGYIAPFAAIDGRN